MVSYRTCTSFNHVFYDFYIMLKYCVNIYLANLKRFKQHRKTSFPMLFIY